MNRKVEKKIDIAYSCRHKKLSLIMRIVGGGIKFFTAILLIVVFPLYAENPEKQNHDKLVPQGETFTADNIYFGFDGRIALPLVFDGNADYSKTGLGLGVEFGYDLAGWLLGLRYAHLMNGTGKMMHVFNHDMLTVEVSKLFTKYHFHFFPEWFDIRLKFGFGVDFSGGRYYKNDMTYEAKLTSEEHFATIMFSPGIFFDFTCLPLITPYFGANFDFTSDIQGIFFIPSISLGFRTSVGKIRAAVKKNSKEADEVPQEPQPVVLEELVSEKDKKISVVDDGENYKISSDAIVFDSDAATFDHLTASQRRSNREVFDSVLRVLKKLPNSKITVKGYANSMTDAPVEAETLIELSLARAQAVRQVLIDNGIETERIDAIGMGDANPVENRKEFAWKNRRVEFLLEK